MAQGYIETKNYGNSWLRGEFESALTIPLYSTIPAVSTITTNSPEGLVVIQTSDNTLQWYSNGVWHTPAGSGTVTSVGISSSDITVGGSPITTAGTITLTLPATGVTAGSYTNASITVDAKGRVIAASSGSGGSGTVTSVAMSVPSILSVSGSPITTSGTLAVTLATQSANTVFAGPTTGSAATPTFRALVTADLPSGTGTVTSVDVSGGTTGLTASGGPITTSGTITLAGTLALANGGTGASLTASAGGIVFSNATTFGILGYPGAANRFLISSTPNPFWSTATIPPSGGGFPGRLLYTDGTNYLISAVAFPVTASATARKILVSDGTDWVASTETYAVPGTSGNILTSNGTNWISSAPATSGTVTSVDVSGGTTGLSASGGPITSSGTITLAGTLVVANGGTGGTSASITLFNNITGYTAAGATGTTSTNLVFSTSPTLVTPILGTPTSGTLTNCTGLPIAGLVASTSTAIGVGSIELGNASDTTIARVSAGVISVEGVTVPTISSTNTLTNKRVTKRSGSTTSSATPTIVADNTDYYEITAQSGNITSMSTNFTIGTPTAGQTLWIAMTAASGTPTVTWGASFEDSTTTAPTTLSTTRVDVGFVWNSATSKFRCIAKA